MYSHRIRGTRLWRIILGLQEVGGSYAIAMLIFELKRNGRFISQHHPPAAS